MNLIKNIYGYREKALVGDCNTYLVEDELRALIDPGNPEYMSDRLDELERDGFNAKEIDLIINTHSHPDHCGANRAFKNLSGARIALHSAELEHLDLSKEFGRYFGMPLPEFKVDFHLGDKLSIDKTEFLVLHTPGHSPGSVSLYCKELKLLICGDLIFEGGVGRTDFPGGSIKQLKNSIELVSKLDLDYLLPGHGDIIKGKEKIKRNFDFIKMYYFNAI